MKLYTVSCSLFEDMHSVGQIWSDKYQGR